VIEDRGAVIAEWANGEESVPSRWGGGCGEGVRLEALGKKEWKEWTAQCP